MFRIALLIEYDGTDFAGSQSQRSQRTVQGTVEAAVKAFTGERRRVAFAGRTDAGVHARGQVVALDTSSAHAPATWRDALNHFLPEDVVVRGAAEVDAGFDPRRGAESRCYRYRIEDGRARSPMTRRGAWQLPHRLDAATMAAAARRLPREARDWSAFCGPVPAGYSTVRALQRCEVRRCGAEVVEVTMEAGGFLPHQVRRTVGALERVGSGRMDVEEFAALVDGPPGSAGPTAPPQGLTLDAVRYPPGTVTWETGTER
ncbi:MAG: tRNA pseudouridine(38-40) synthase TruA [Chloroflexi bacterium]|nr:tRNA pseudouridine(38-40) synthase TruA [Chloroflexota bacterium]